MQPLSSIFKGYFETLVFSLANLIKIGNKITQNVHLCSVMFEIMIIGFLSVIMGEFYFIPYNV